MYKATIVIPNINGKGWLKDSIESVYAQTEQNFRLIVVDNGSTDESLEQARSYCSRANFTLIENGTNTGFSHAVNQGIALADSEYVVLFNNDAFAEPQWLEELIRTAETDPKIFAVQSLMIRHFDRELADDAGFFAALIPRKTMADYTLLVFYDNGTLGEIHDPYSFAPQFTDADLKKFEAGIHYGIYNKMGAHPMTVKGTAGVYFAVWAPCAMRVSVVGRRHQMRKLGESGIFEIFIPGVKKGAVYKYEVKFKNGDPALKADPYANYAELRPNTASVVWDLNEYQWNDGEWMDKRAKTDTKTAPMSMKYTSAPG